MLFLLLLFFAFRPKWPCRPLWPAVTALLLLAADAAVLWGSTNDVSWQVSTAGDRLLMQVWPVLLMCGFWWLAGAQDIEAPAPEARRPEKRKIRDASGSQG